MTNFIKLPQMTKSRATLPFYLSISPKSHYSKCILETLKFFKKLISFFVRSCPEWIYKKRISVKFGHSSCATKYNLINAWHHCGVLCIVKATFPEAKLCKVVLLVELCIRSLPLTITIRVCLWNWVDTWLRYF